MSIIKVDYGTISGGGSVKSGTFEITNAGTAGTGSFDTELGNSVKRVIIVGENPTASSGKFSAIIWDEAYAEGFKYVQVGSAGAGSTATINTYNNTTIYLTKQPNTNNGIVEYAWTSLKPTNKNGTYYWYAE